MSKSTPINQIRNEGDNSELVNNILNDYEKSEQSEEMPPQEQQRQEYDEREEFQYDPRRQHDDRYYGQEMVGSPPPPDNWMNEAKGPLLVMLLVFITNLGIVDQTLEKYIPFIGEGSMLGLAAKALLAGVLFYILKRFL